MILAILQEEANEAWEKLKRAEKIAAIHCSETRYHAAERAREDAHDAQERLNCVLAGAEEVGL